MKGELRNSLFGITYSRMDGPSKISGRPPLNNLKGYSLPSRAYPFKDFRGCFPQIVFGLFLDYFIPFKCCL